MSILQGVNWYTSVENQAGNLVGGAYWNIPPRLFASVGSPLSFFFVTLAIRIRLHLVFNLRELRSCA